MRAINIDIKANANAFEWDIESIAVCLLEARNLFTVVVLLHRSSTIQSSKFVDFVYLHQHSCA